VLSQVARTVTGHDRKLHDLSTEVAGLREVVAAHDRKLDDLAAGFASRRGHPLSFGQGLLISKLDERVRHIERHLRIEPAGN